MFNSKQSFKLPDFLVIGAGKSGTTSLNNYLKQHPEIFIPSKKEPNFFAYEMVKRENIVQNKELCKHFDFSVTDFEEYKNLFLEANDSQKIGETSNLYLYNEFAPQQIKYYIPKAKFIAVLRNPVDRLYSRYLHLARENRQAGINFDDIYDRNSIWHQRPDLLHEGFYFRNLRRFMSHFKEDQFLIFLYDDFRNDQNKVLSEIFTFLGVDSSFQPDTTINFNKSGFVKNNFYNQFVNGNGFLLSAIKKSWPSLYLRAMKNQKIQKTFYKLKSKNLERPKFDPEIRSNILNKIYREDIEQLQNLLDRDLHAWLT